MIDVLDITDIQGYNLKDEYSDINSDSLDTTSLGRTRSSPSSSSSKKPQICFDQINQCVNYLFIPVAILLTFILLELPYIHSCLDSYFETNFLLISFKALIIFLVAYLTDRWVYNWRINHPPYVYSWEE